MAETALIYPVLEVVAVVAAIEPLTPLVLM
jgi:hypothetical protein